MAVFDKHQRAMLLEHIEATLREEGPLDDSTLYLAVIDHIKTNEPAVEDDWVHYYWGATVDEAVDEGKLIYALPSAKHPMRQGGSSCA